MEEIDIIELLKRVKEGKAPKRIQAKIKGEINTYDYKFDNYVYYSGNEDEYYSIFEAETLPKLLDTKIKILDKPIIEELKPIDDGYISKSPDNFEIMAKINEIIKWINKENKDE